MSTPEISKNLNARTGRRRFLSVFGSTALASSAIIFGSRDEAQAGNYACCYLVYAPSSYSACRSGRNYTWNCQWTATTGCSCCERMRADGTYYASAYSCSRV